MGLVRPHGIDKPKVIDSECREDLIRAERRPGRTRRAGEDLGVGERKSRQAQRYVAGDADVDATKRSTRKIFSYAVGGHEDLVQVAAARANAAIH